MLRVRREGGDIWRHDVLAAEPRAEITITADEIAQVEKQIDHYTIDTRG